MKEGLRKQFRQILQMPDIDYFGNVIVGKQGDLTLEDLKAVGFQALLVAVGAQGTKWLGLPGKRSQTVSIMLRILSTITTSSPFQSK